MSNHTLVHIPETVIKGRRLGRHREHDERSRAFGVGLYGGPLASVKHTRHCAPFDQGDLGSCTGNAMAGALMTGPLYKAGRILGEAEAVQLYSVATRLDRIAGHYPPDDTGSSGLAVCKAAKQAGMINSYRHAFGVQQALESLVHGPVIIGIDWYSEFDTPHGHDAQLMIGGEIRGGHELVLDEIDVQRGLVLGTNSWGTGWGNQGRFCLSFGTFRKLLINGGDCTVPS